MPWPELYHVLRYQLSIVLVGRKHISPDALGIGLVGEGAYNVVGLETFGLKDWYVERFEQPLDDRHALANVLGSGLALRLVFGESLVAKGLAKVEGHAQMGGLFLFHDFMQGVAEAQYCRCVQTF